MLTLPFLYLGVTNALVIAEEKITFSTFWSLTQNEYDWTDGVKYVDIDYSISIESDSNRKSFNGKYILHFSDGKQIDLWANTLEGGIDTVQEIDSFIQTKNIPFYVRRAPAEDTINRFFTENANFIRELYSR
ncbi:metal-dependent hydrolases of the beta-lactamase superfamily III [Bacillus sp. OxB-1]|nr:metal-dependent hydrolases of the beta-lactamase superfamily III [Bacillus sp. OxB-1]